MKYRLCAVAVLGVLGVIPAMAQSSPSDSQTLQAILNEIRTIREELKATEATQILLSELGLEQNVVNRATQRVEDLRTRLQSVQSAEKQAADHLAQMPEAPEAAASPEEQMEFAMTLANLKDTIARHKIEEQNDSDSLQKAQQQLRDAQDKLDSIEDQLNSIVKRLSPAGQ